MTCTGPWRGCLGRGCRQQGKRGMRFVWHRDPKTCRWVCSCFSLWVHPGTLPASFALAYLQITSVTKDDRHSSPCLCFATCDSDIRRPPVHVVKLNPYPSLQFKKGDRVIALTFGYHWEYQEYGARASFLVPLFRALGFCTQYLMPAVQHAALSSTASCLHFLCCLPSLQESSPD